MHNYPEFTNSFHADIITGRFNFEIFLMKKKICLRVLAAPKELILRKFKNTFLLMMETQRQTKCLALYDTT